jgi:nucleotide-binding universal stress UspA family protein
MRILAATDGSGGSEKAIEFASKLASESNSSLTIIHVIPHIPTTYEEIITLVKEEIGDPKKAGDKYLAKGREIAEKYGIEPDLLLREGNPVMMIKEEAKSFDLIVVGSHGKGKINESLLGSVSSKLVHISKVPVLVVR